MKKLNILFIYPATNHYSGQTKASEIIIDLFSCTSNILIKPSIFPALERNSNFFEYIIYIYKLLLFYTSQIIAIFKKYDYIYLSLGQSLSKLILLGLPVILSSILLRRKVICSIHGNDFTEWNSKSLNYKLYSYILKNTFKITTLGERHELTLKKMGISQFIRVPNTIEILPLELKTIIEKQNSNQIKLLHLSTLLETKGFIRYIESIKLLKGFKQLNSTLCGPIMFSNSCKTLKTYEEKENYILKSITDLNGNLNWIKGAKGLEKEKLFIDANIFIFPSNFPTESLPLVILEAAATGCAIISTRVGELPNYFSDQDIFYLDSIDPVEIYQKIKILINDKDKRINFSINSNRVFIKKFSQTAYFNNWNNIFN